MASCASGGDGNRQKGAETGSVRSHAAEKKGEKGGRRAGSGGKADKQGRTVKEGRGGGPTGVVRGGKIEINWDQNSWGGGRKRRGQTGLTRVKGGEGSQGGISRIVRGGPDGNVSGRGLDQGSKNRTGRGGRLLPSGGDGRTGSRHRGERE